MKQLKLTIIILTAVMLQNLSGFSQGIAINDDGTDANTSAMLDIKSNAGTQGFLLPRMTAEQKDAIASPATSLLVYQTDGVSGFYYYNGSDWEAVSKSMDSFLTVAAAEAASANENDLCYVDETETFYRFETTATDYTNDNQYVLSTIDGGDTRWLGVSGKYNLGSISLMKIEHLDATSGTATITELNKVYFIAGNSTLTVITIPDCISQNDGWFLQIYKESGGVIRLRTESDQEIDHQVTQDIYTNGQGCTIKADMEHGGGWHKIQDSRTDIPVTISLATDYDENEDWLFDFLLLDSDDGDLTFTAPVTLSLLPEGSRRMIFNTGSNLVYGDPNGYALDGSVEFRVIGPGGYIELQKINGFIKSIREKNVTLRKEVTEISNLMVWLDASQLSGTDGSSLATWTDLSGNGHNFTATNQPTLQTIEQNEKNVVRFDGVNDVMSAGDVEIHDNARGLTMIAVVKPTNTKRMPILSKYKTSIDNRQFAFGNQDNFLFETLDWSGATGTVLTMSQNDFQIAEMVWTPGQTFELYINGVLQTSGNLPVNTISEGSANLMLGAGDYTSLGFWEGDFAEIMVYSAAVSDSERELLRENLALKWDIDEIIIANGGAKYWQRDDNTNTISPDVADDNLDIGGGTFTSATVTTTTLNVSILMNAPALSTAPISPQAGSIYFNTTDNKLKVYTGTIWQDLN